MSVLIAEGASYLSHALNVLILFVGLLLGFIILIQRGRGQGVMGLVGGSGGSAFGSKAGDAFTKITSIMFAVWIFLIMANVRSIKCDADPSRAGQNLATSKQ